jgi:hypothetical protein
MSMATGDSAEMRGTPVPYWSSSVGRSSNSLPSSGALYLAGATFHSGPVNIAGRQRLSRDGTGEETFHYLRVRTTSTFAHGVVKMSEEKTVEGKSADEVTSDWAQHMESLDLATEEGIREFVEIQKKVMEDTFENEGRFEVNGYSNAVYLLKTYDMMSEEELRNLPRGWIKHPELARGKKLDRVGIMAVALPSHLKYIVPDHLHTEILSKFIRFAVEATKAIGTVTLMETWVASVPGDEESDWRKARAELPESLADYEGREEALCISVEHVLIGTKFWRANITRDPTVLHPWKEVGGVMDGGRLSGFLGVRV